MGPASSARRSSRAREGAPAYLALRFGWIYGPGRRRGWRDVQARIERVIAGARRIEYPDLPDPIDWTWVHDAAEILLRAMTCPLAPFVAANALGDRRRVADAFAHLQRRFPDLAV